MHTINRIGLPRRPRGRILFLLHASSAPHLTHLPCPEWKPVEALPGNLLVFYMVLGTFEDLSRASFPGDTNAPSFLGSYAFKPG